MPWKVLLSCTVVWDGAPFLKCNKANFVCPERQVPCSLIVGEIRGVEVLHACKDIYNWLLYSCDILILLWCPIFSPSPRLCRDLSSNSIISLPEGIFQGLRSLSSLWVFGTQTNAYVHAYAYIHIQYVRRYITTQVHCHVGWQTKIKFIMTDFQVLNCVCISGYAIHVMSVWNGLHTQKHAYCTL